jgi:secreted PhoX family phosphatase
MWEKCPIRTVVFVSAVAPLVRPGLSLRIKEEWMTTIDRRTFLRRGAAVGGGLMALGPLHALGARAAFGAPPPEVTGYGPLVDKGELFLPAAFNYQVISRQGTLQRDGNPTPGIFDGMGAFPGLAGTTVLIRNHENRERPGEIKVVVPEPYDELAFGGNTKLTVRRERAGTNAEGGRVGNRSERRSR